MTQTMELGNLQKPGLVPKLRAFVRRRTEGRAVILLAVISLVVVIYEPLVFTAYPVTLGRIALIGLVALGLTAVILMGELDLSVASTLAASGVIVAVIPDLRIAIPVALLTGIAVGIVNAFFVAIVGIASFIATLGMLFGLSGLAFVLSGEEPLNLQNQDAGILFSQPVLGPLTPRILLFFLVFIALQLFVTRMKAGREFFAVGGNRQAAYDSGIPVKRRIFTGFIISGFVSALAGVIYTLTLTTASPDAGSNVLLSSFAAAIIGGNYLKGGKGSIVGTLLGATALGMLQTTFLMSGIQVPVQNTLIGAILLLAVITDPTSLRALIEKLRSALSKRAKVAPS